MILTDDDRRMLDGAEGPAVAGEINMMVRSNVFAMLFGGRFYYDIAIPNTGLLLAPNTGIGLVFIHLSSFFGSATHFAQSSGYSPLGPGGTLPGGSIRAGSASRPGV